MAYQRLKCLIFSFLLTTGNSQIEPEPFDHDTLQFVSMGYVLKPMRAVRIFSDTAHLFFHFTLPPQVQQPEDLIDCRHDLVDQYDICMELRPSYALLQAIRHSAAQLVDNAIDLAMNLTDCLQQHNRVKRYPQFLSRIFSSLTGLGTSDELEVLKQSVKTLQGMTLNSMSSFTANQNRIVSLAKIQSKQMEQVAALTKMTRDDIDHINELVQEHALYDIQRFTLFYHVSKAVFKHAEAIVQFSALNTALESLFAGKITNFLIPVTLLQETLNNLSAHLDNEHNHLTIVYKDPVYYYRSTNFVVFRKIDDIIIRLDVPLSNVANSKFVVFQLIKLPLSIPGTSNSFSLLSLQTKAIALNENYYATFDNDITYVPDALDLNDATFQLKSRDFQTCETALLAGDHDLVMRLCQYHVILASEIPKLFIRLAPTKFYVSGIKKLLLRCDDKIMDYSDKVLNKQAVINTPCACHATADEIYIPPSATLCNDTAFDLNTNAAVYPINFAFLSQLFADTDEIKKLNPLKLYKSFPNITIPALPSRLTQYNKLLAMTADSKFELTQIINSTKQGKSLFDTAGHIALQQILDSSTTDDSFDIFSSKDWLLALLMLATILLSATMAYLFSKMKTLSTMVLVLSNTRPGLAQLTPDKLNLLFTTKMTPPPASIISLDSLSVISELISLEAAILSFLILLFLSIIVLAIYRYYHKFHFGAQTKCFLQVGNITSSICIPWASLSYPPGFYTIKTTLKATEVGLNIQVGSWICGYDKLSVNGVQLSINNINLDLQIDMILCKSIPFFLSRKLLRIMHDNYFVVFLLTDSCRKIRFCTILKPFHAYQLQQPLALPLYPMLEDRPL